MSKESERPKDYIHDLFCCYSFQTKLNELYKNLQNQQNGIFFNFGWKLAAKRIIFVILRSFRFFWHPWGRLSSGDMSFKICLEYFATVAPPGGFFHFLQNDLPCQLYDLGPLNSDFVTIYTQKSNNYILRFITSSGWYLNDLSINSVE